MDRRKFLRNGLALGCSAAASPVLTQMAFASAPWDTRIVVLILRGAMDGLDVVQPYGDPAYAALRPTLGLGPAGGALDLDGFYALHPALDRLMPLWHAGQLGFAHAVSTPYRDKRSHFDGQDLLEAGGDTVGGLRDGWLNRLMTATPAVTAEAAYAIGRDHMLILSGDAPVSRWSPEAQLTLTPQAKRLLERVYEGDPLFEQASTEAVMIAESLAAEEESPMSDAAARRGTVALAKFAASRLRDESRIASFSLAGWDTHVRQAQSLPRALHGLADVILTLQQELGPVWDKTAVIALTEFGRTARENGDRGTDHGTGGVMLTAGGAIRGGRVIGAWPGLGEGDLYADRDLMPTRDVRALAGWVLRSLIGTEASVLETSVFPGVDLGEDPGFLS